MNRRKAIAVAAAGITAISATAVIPESEDTRVFKCEMSEEFIANTHNALENEKYANINSVVDLMLAESRTHVKP